MSGISRRALVTLWVLASAVFAATLGTMLVPGVLPVFASETGIPLADIGRSNAVFGIAYAVAAPSIAWLLRRRQPYAVMIVALPVAGAMLAVVSQSDTATELYVARALQAVAVAGVVPMCTVHAGSIVGAAHRSRALSISFTGMVLSSLVGAPLGNTLASAIGARSTFLVAAVCALAVAAVAWALRLWQPGLRARGIELRATDSAVGVASVTAVIVLAATLATALLEGAATGGLNTFVSPFLTAATGADGVLLSGLLLCYGVAGLAGNGLLGAVADRRGPARVLTGVCVAAAASVAGLMIADTPTVAAAFLLAWGFCSWAINPPLQALIVAHAGRHLGLLVGVNSSVIFTGSSLGAALASAQVDRDRLTTLPWLAAGLFVGSALTAAVAWVTIARGRSRARRASFSESRTSSG
ncbi:MFS transporter [Demequina aestuarii]|uniref:MFS transporter n=1 Tax=Demequina aestuarii TaxID=327095 RepID=UPI000782A168|nr:MFS transporter [Demequina aestuarii]